MEIREDEYRKIEETNKILYSVYNTESTMRNGNERTSLHGRKGRKGSLIMDQIQTDEIGAFTMKASEPEEKINLAEVMDLAETLKRAIGKDNGAKAISDSAQTTSRRDMTTDEKFEKSTKDTGPDPAYIENLVKNTVDQMKDRFLTEVKNIQVENVKKDDSAQERVKEVVRRNSIQIQKKIEHLIRMMPRSPTPKSDDFYDDDDSVDDRKKELNDRYENMETQSREENMETIVRNTVEEMKDVVLSEIQKVIMEEITDENIEVIEKTVDQMKETFLTEVQEILESKTSADNVDKVVTKFADEIDKTSKNIVLEILKEKEMQSAMKDMDIKELLAAHQKQILRMVRKGSAQRKKSDEQQKEEASKEDDMKTIVLKTKYRLIDDHRKMRSDLRNIRKKINVLLEEPCVCQLEMSASANYKAMKKRVAMVDSTKPFFSKKKIFPCPKYYRPYSANTRRKMEENYNQNADPGEKRALKKAGRERFNKKKRGPNKKE